MNASRILKALMKMSAATWKIWQDSALIVSGGRWMLQSSEAGHKRISPLFLKSIAVIITVGFMRLGIGQGSKVRIRQNLPSRLVRPKAARVAARVLTI